MATKNSIFDKTNCGIILDCSADSAEYLNKRLIALANQYGGKILPEANDSYSEFVNAAWDEAVDYLNTLVSDDVYFIIDDNSLFLRETEED